MLFLIFLLTLKSSVADISSESELWSAKSHSPRSLLQYLAYSESVSSETWAEPYYIQVF